MKFKSDKSVVQVLGNLNSLGNVESVRKTDSYHVYKVQSSNLYKVKIMKDMEKCYILGICELPSGEVLIADSDNGRLKLLNRKYEVIDHHDLPVYPQHLCHTTGNEVAVAVNGISTIEIHFFTVTKEKLQAVRNLDTYHQCISIAHHQGQLYVCSRNALYLLTIGKRLIKKIYEDNTSFQTIGKCAVSADGERIYVTNPTASTLITLDTSGHVLSTLEDHDLQRPTALCVSPSGHVFVCGKDSHTVVQVDQEGRQKIATVARKADGFCSPRSVWFSEQTSNLIVGNLGDNITVVKLC